MVYSLLDAWTSLILICSVVDTDVAEYQSYANIKTRVSVKKAKDFDTPDNILIFLCYFRFFTVSFALSFLVDREYVNKGNKMHPILL